MTIPVRTESYDRYVDHYKSFHSKHDDEKEHGYPGRSILRQLRDIQLLCAHVKATSLLDYGCGQGEQ
jgi:hypothetical protein